MVETWVQELRNKGQVETVAIPREENKSDMLTDTLAHCLSSGNFNKEVGRIQTSANWDWIIVDFELEPPAKEFRQLGGPFQATIQLKCHIRM